MGEPEKLPEKSLVEPFLETSRDLRIHLRAWDEGQMCLLRILLDISPYASDLTPIIRHLLEGLRTDIERRGHLADRDGDATDHL